MAVVLNKYEDMNYAEIAQVMRLTTKAVKSLLSRARCRLRDALTAYLAVDSAFIGRVAPPADEPLTRDGT
jgi:RNA polymerase sigma-70 factor (ECF subfamily)